MKRVSKISPDAEMYKQCRASKFSNKVASTRSVTGRTSTVDKKPGFEVISPLAKFFSEEELYGIYDKARAEVKNNRIRDGFKQHSFLVDSGRPLPYTVQRAYGGNYSCTCTFFPKEQFVSSLHCCCYENWHTRQSCVQFFGDEPHKDNNIICPSFCWLKNAT